MKLKIFTTTILALTVILHGCQKSVAIQEQPFAQVKKKILIDASKDGGVWWYPQSNNFSSASDHQGKQLADYLSSLGYEVDEVPRGIIISESLLKQYDKVIRAGGFGNYTDSEIAAYDAFLNRRSSLMLLQDHLKNFPNDNLSEHLGVQFEGFVSGYVTQFVAHDITVGVSSLYYYVGSVVINSNKNSNMTILGSLGSEPVMGILNNYPSSRIFFMGEMNNLETVPQPFTDNLLKWLFE